MTVRWLRWLGLFVLHAAILSAAVALVLWANDAFLTVQRQGGDQSQSSSVDLTPRDDPGPLPILSPSAPRNVVLLLGDGLGFSQVAAARSELVGLNDKLFFERFPFTGWQTTHSLESLYTDSASSASSLATGHKVAYRSVSTSADGRPLRTVAEAARDKGMAVGVVTDSYLWDATPSAFLTHAASRRHRVEIARQFADSGARLLVGEAHPSQLSNDGSDSEELAELLTGFRRRGFAVARTSAELGRAERDGETPLLALFDPGEISAADRPPELLELAELAFDRLSTDPGGYFLVVETEEPDTGGHNRDLRRVVRGIAALDEVAALAVEHALADRSTLVILTSDHETGALALLHGDRDNRLGIRWGTRLHSAEPVPIYAFGAGAERFTGVKDNTDIARVLSDLLGLGMFEAADPSLP